MTKSQMENQIQSSTSGYLKTNGSVSVNSNLNLNNHKIVNVGTHSSNESSAAVNVNFLDDSNQEIKYEITGEYKAYIDKSHISSSEDQDVFYLMDNLSSGSAEQNVTNLKLTNFIESPHQVNKKAWQFNITKDSDNSNYEYHARIGYDLNPLRDGKYTLIMELLFFGSKCIHASRK